MEVEAKVHEVADLLRKTPELQEYYQAKDALERDLEARRSMRYYQRAQENLRALLARGETPAEYMIQDYEMLRREYQDNEIIQNYLHAQSQAQDLVKRITGIISQETGVQVGGCAGCGRRSE